MKETYHVIHHLMEQSGFHWDPQNGADINLEMEEVWRQYVQVYSLLSTLQYILYTNMIIIQKHPKAAPFCNKGWPLYEEFQQLMPTMAKGLNAFYPTQVQSCEGSNSALPSDKGMESDEEMQNYDADEDEGRERVGACVDRSKGYR